MLFAAFAEILRMVLRGSSTPVFIIAFSIPVAVASSYGVSASALADQVALFSGSSQRAAGPQEALCHGVTALPGRLVAGEEEHLIQVHVVRDLEAYLAVYQASASAPAGQSQRPRISLGSELARIVSSSPGPAEICFNGSCRALASYGVHSGRGSVAWIAVVEDRDAEGHGQPVCREGRALGVLARLFAGSLADLAARLSAVSLAPYTILSLLAGARVVGSLEKDLRVLADQGVPLRILRASLALAVAVSSTIFVAYGVSMGVVASHAAMHLLGLLGALVVERPLPSPGILLTVLAYAMCASAAAALSSAVGVARLGRVGQGGG